MITDKNKHLNSEDSDFEIVIYTMLDIIVASSQKQPQRHHPFKKEPSERQETAQNELSIKPGPERK